MLDVAIAGSGPYGLAIASHLRARGVSFRIFGQPMRFWQEMPEKMSLKSFAFATTISNPAGLTYDRWCRERGLEDREPCSIQSFAEYGLWIQKQLVPEVEPTDITRIEPAAGGFRLTLATGEQLEARRAVVALGLRYFHRIPAALAQLPGTLFSHTADHRSYHKFRGKDVCVLGAGQSALEAATLLHESGARVQLLVRGPKLCFYTRTPVDRPLGTRLWKPLSVVGEGKLGWALQHFPMVPYFAPDWLRVRLTRRFLGPAGAWWLRDRFEGNVPVQLRCEVISVRPDEDGIALRVRQGDQGEREFRVDHVVAGTGYDVDIDRLPILDGELRSRVERIERAPRLNRHFESSVAGLYFVGALSMYSFGPLCRFVVGTAFTAPAVARHIARQALRASAPQPAISASSGTQ